MNQIVLIYFDSICIHHTPCLFPSFHESKLLTEAAKLQLKAAKTDILFKMLDSFNKNSIQVTTRWTLLDNMLGTSLPPLSTQNASPQATRFLPFSPSSKSSRPFCSRSKTTPTSRNPPRQGRSVLLFHSLDHSDHLHGYWSCEKHQRAAHMHRPHGQLLPTLCGCTA